MYQKRRTKIIFITFIILILAENIFKLFLNETSAVDSVGLKIAKKPKIDIVLAKSKTTTTVTNFETDLRRELNALGIDARVESDYVDIQSVKAENVDISSSFNWTKDVSSSIR